MGLFGHKAQKRKDGFMKKILVILLFLNVSTTFAFEMNLDCETKAHMDFEERMNKAKEELAKELEYCFKFPYGEKFEQCQYNAQQIFNNEKEKFKETLKQNLRFCKKYPNF